MTSLEIRLAPEQLAELVEHIVSQLRETENDRWFTTREAAEYLGTHPVTLRRLAAARKVPFEQDAPGHALYFRRSALDTWREGGRR